MNPFMMRSVVLSVILTAGIAFRILTTRLPIFFPGLEYPAGPDMPDISEGIIWASYVLLPYFGGFAFLAHFHFGASPYFRALTHSLIILVVLPVLFLISMDAFHMGINEFGWLYIATPLVQIFAAIFAYYTIQKKTMLEN